MNKTKRIGISILAAILLLCSPVMAALPPYYPPVLTVLTLHAPDDLTVTIIIKKENKTIPVEAEAKHRVWEWQHRLYRAEARQIKAWYGNHIDLKDAELVFTGGGETRAVVIPDEMLTVRGAEDYVTMDWQTGQLSRGLPGYRTPLLYAMWIGIAVLIEGVFFFCYGFRKGKSWLMFLLINLVTQGLQHTLAAGMNLTPYMRSIYVGSIPVLILVEMVAFVMLVDELPRDKTITFAVVGNLVSQAALGVLLPVLPV